jgi:glutamine synthetase adenylyltransferase
MSRLDDIIAKSGAPKRGAAEFVRFQKSFTAIAGRPFDTEQPGTNPIIHLFGNSQVLAQRLIQNPAWADDIAQSLFTESRKPSSLLGEEIQSLIQSIDDCAALMHALRNYKYREMSRIVGRDLAGGCSTEEILAEWSDLADNLIIAAYNFSYKRLILKYGQPIHQIDKENRVDCTGTIIALGKLGSQELNLSSDIDILIIYSSDDGGCDNISNHEFYIQLARDFTKTLSTVTEDGFVYRVDHELRPEGIQGPLANSIAAAERYYQYFGHDWERSALIRARAVAGDHSLGNEFIDAVRPFVYRRSISIPDLSHMREMKEKFERKSMAGHGAFDLKLGVGGIREVEFLVQTLQQLYGGNLPSLRKTNTFAAIEALEKESIIHPYAADLLEGAYSFLRHLENMVQAEGDLQTHRMPSTPESLTALSCRMGLGDKEKLIVELEKYTYGVKRLFRGLFEADYDLLELQEAMRDNLSKCSDEEEESDSLAWFKQQEWKRIMAFDLEKAPPIGLVLKKLSLAADVITRGALDIAYRRLAEKYGEPSLEDGNRAGFAIVAFGKLGSREIDYGSDLDLCFLYEGSGRTSGEKSISNIEFFTKLAQRTISKMSLPTRYGRAFEVDSELRPSGKQGSLVATLVTFNDYHTNHSEIWERIALLRTRVIAGDDEFAKHVEDSLTHLAFEQSPPAMSKAREESDDLRNRFINERVRETDDIYNVKIGPGGLADLETVISLLHLENACKHLPLRQRNTFDVLRALCAQGILDYDLSEEMLEQLVFLRTLLSRMRALSGRSTDSLDFRRSYIKALTEQMGFKSSEDLRRALETSRKRIREIYKEFVISD